jgi:hypothetical protein
MKQPRSDLSCSDRKKDISHVVIMMLEFIQKMENRDLAAINLLEDLLQIVACKFQ